MVVKRSFKDWVKRKEKKKEEEKEKAVEEDVVEPAAPVEEKKKVKTMSLKEWKKLQEAGHGKGKGKDVEGRKESGGERREKVSEVEKVAEEKVAGPAQKADVVKSPVQETVQESPVAEKRVEEDKMDEGEVEPPTQVEEPPKPVEATREVVEMVVETPIPLVKEPTLASMREQPPQAEPEDNAQGVEAGEIIEDDTPPVVHRPNGRYNGSRRSVDIKMEEVKALFPPYNSSPSTSKPPAPLALRISSPRRIADDDLISLGSPSPTPSASSSRNPIHAPRPSLPSQPRATSSHSASGTPVPGLPPRPGPLPRSIPTSTRLDDPLTPMGSRAPPLPSPISVPPPPMGRGRGSQAPSGPSGYRRGSGGESRWGPPLATSASPPRASLPPTPSTSSLPPASSKLYAPPLLPLPGAPSVTPSTTPAQSKPIPTGPRGPGGWRPTGSASTGGVGRGGGYESTFSQRVGDRDQFDRGYDRAHGSSYQGWDYDRQQREREASWETRSRERDERGGGGGTLGRKPPAAPRALREAERYRK